MTYGNLSVDQLTSSTGQSLSPASSSATMKNRLINGGMVIDQRNNGASVTLGAVNPQYSVDRWLLQTSQASKLSFQQNAGGVTTPVGFSNYLGITSLSAYSSVSTDYFTFAQRIEAFNANDLAWGTSNAKTVTLSFWVYSSLTGTFSGALNNNQGTSSGASYAFTYSIPTANTWTYITVTVQGSTIGTWSNNGSSICVVYNLGCGSNYLTSTPNSWQANGQYFGVTGTVSVVGTSGATFYITGVQLEVGTVASSFDYRDYGRELIMCQRYYQTNFLHTLAANTTSGDATLVFPVQMRTTPSTSYTDTTGALGKYTDSGGSGQTFAVDASGGTTGAWRLQTALARSAAWVQLNYFFNSEL